MPNDIEAKRGLAAAYRGQGQAEKAQALEQEIVAAGGAAPPAGAPGAGAGSADLMNVGVNLYNDKKYAEAAEAFGKVAEAEPYNRDALFNLANTYLALKDGPKLLATAQRLIAIEPMNENSLKLVGEGYKQVKAGGRGGEGRGEGPGAAGRRPVTDFSTGGQQCQPDRHGHRPRSADAGGQADRRRRRSRWPWSSSTPKARWSGPARIVAIPPLATGKAQEIKATAQGAGIVAWRYKRK